MALRKLTENTLLPRYPGDVHQQLHDAGEEVDVPDELLEGEYGLDARGVTVPVEGAKTSRKRSH